MYVLPLREHDKIRYGWQEGERHGLFGRLLSLWSGYLPAWESTCYLGGTEQHADSLVITSYKILQDMIGQVRVPGSPCCFC